MQESLGKFIINKARLDIDPEQGDFMIICLDSEEDRILRTELEEFMYLEKPLKLVVEMFK